MELPVIVDRVDVGFTFCPSYNPLAKQDHTASVWRPAVSGRFPVISFAHGMKQGNDDIMKNNMMLSSLASEGYIIIAHRAAWNIYCWDQTKD